ncbi:MAG: hypothetical protein ACE5LA_00185, partial [Dehalococcoidales bacterium]
TSHRNLEDAIKNRKLKKMVRSYIKKLVQEHDEHSVICHFGDMLNTREPSTADILAKSSRFISPKCGSEAVLSIGTGIEWMESPEFAGVISVMPHGCMPGGIVAAMAEKFCMLYQKPWISLTYDGFLETNNFARVNNFAEIIKFCRQEAKEGVA